jgi:hypothetical protein
VYIDYDDGFRRIPKQSYRWFQELLGGADQATAPADGSTKERP